MSMTLGPRNLTGPSSVARAAGAAAILSGVLVLAGWTFDVAVLKSLIPGLTAMNPGGSALAFLLAGVSLWVQASEVMTSRRRAIGIACAVVVLLIGLARVGGISPAGTGGPTSSCFARTWSGRRCGSASRTGWRRIRPRRSCSSGWRWRCSTWRPAEASGPPSSSP